MSDAKVEALIDEADINHDGVIDYKEFIKMMKDDDSHKNYL